MVRRRRGPDINKSRKWAPHTEWCYERQGMPLAVLRRVLKVHVRTIDRWDKGLRPVPHWAPKVLRLNRMDAAVVLAQMTGQDAVPLDGLVFVNLPKARVPIETRRAA